jgi:serine/threonine protein kinase
MFIAPEIIESSGLWDAYTPACDIYALGVSLFRLLSGEFPFKETDPEELEFEKLSGKISYS